MVLNFDFEGGVEGIWLHLYWAELINTGALWGLAQLPAAGASDTQRHNNYWETCQQLETFENHPSADLFVRWNSKLRGNLKSGLEEESSKNEARLPNHDAVLCCIDGNVAELWHWTIEVHYALWIMELVSIWFCFCFSFLFGILFFTEILYFYHYTAKHVGSFLICW